MVASQNSKNPKPISIDEENLSTDGDGPPSNGFNQPEMNQFFSSWGAGLATAEQLLTNMANGVVTQNIFQLAQYYYGLQTAMPAGASYFYGWGSVIDMGGPTNLKRPQFLAAQVVNSVITPGAKMLATTQGGTNPTFSVGNVATYPAAGSTINTVATSATNPVNQVLSYAFDNGSGNYSLILLNLDTANPQPVTFGGMKVPTGNVNVTMLNSANLTDNNETGANIVPQYSSLASPAGVTLPAHSLMTLSWTTQQQAVSISNISVSGVTPTSATISWTTDQPASSLVNYGATVAYGSSSVLDSTFLTSHSVTLNGLNSSSLYNFNVVSAGASGSPVTSANNTFSTSANVSANAPSVGYVVAWGITTTGATVTWSTNFRANTQLLYGTVSPPTTASPLQTALVSSHGVTLSGLLSGTTYYYVAQSSANGVTGFSNIRSFTTGGVASTPGVPVISNASASTVTNMSAMITWLTDQPTTSQVTYGTNNSSLSSPVNPNLTTSHSVVLSGLLPAANYAFQVLSSNSSGVQATYSSTFTTLGATSSAPAPQVGYVVAWGITTSGATITWSTNFAADTQLLYGTTSPPTTASPLQTLLGSSHGVTLSGLLPGTTYYFVAQSSANGVTGTSSVSSFTTGH